MSSLTPTARVILGMLKLGVRTGYDVKKVIDTSTRFFWGASYGQIYPELKRLRAAGLVRAKDEPRGQVKRTVYSLTAAGEKALHEWLTDTETFTFEMRDEGLLRLFFGDALSREEIVANLRAQIGLLDLVLARFRASSAPVSRARRNGLVRIASGCTPSARSCSASERACSSPSGVSRRSSSGSPGAAFAWRTR